MTQEQGAWGAKYKGIADDLRNQIESGKLPAGTKLPTREELAATYGMSGGTVVRALEVLREEGFIRADQGVGTFVLAPEQRTPTPAFTEIVALVGEMRDELRQLRDRVDGLEKLAGSQDES